MNVCLLVLFGWVIRVNCTQTHTHTPWVSVCVCVCNRRRTNPSAKTNNPLSILHSESGEKPVAISLPVALYLFNSWMKSHVPFNQTQPGGLELLICGRITYMYDTNIVHTTRPTLDVTSTPPWMNHLYPTIMIRAVRRAVWLRLSKKKCGGGRLVPDYNFW